MKEVRLVGDNVEQGVYPILEAVRIAEEQGLDLVEISPTAVPPVCKVIDYQKFLYQQKKKEKEQKAKAAKVVLKEIRFGPQTDDHDYNFKLKHAMGFLKEGCKVKAYVFFKGRSILFKGVRQGGQHARARRQAHDTDAIAQKAGQVTVFGFNCNLKYSRNA